nr:hypothetical protein [Tanacetum cinerariifolium]
MILESIENGPLIWPTIEENGLPSEVYALVSNHKVAKERLGRIQLLMQGTLLTKQERECKLTYTPGASGSKRKRDDSWFKDKVLLVQAQANGQILREEELAFLADPGIVKDALAEVHNSDNTDKNIIKPGVHVRPSSKHSNVVNHSETKITSDSNIIPYSQYVHETQHAAVQNLNSSAQQDALILSVIDHLKTQIINCTKINLDNKSVNDTLTAELERYKEQVKVLKEGQNVNLKSQDNVSDSCEQSVEIVCLKQTLSEQIKEKESLMNSYSSKK